jgi:cytochrome P450
MDVVLVRLSPTSLLTSPPRRSSAKNKNTDSLAADVVVKRRLWIEYIGYLMTPGNFLAETFPLLTSLPDFLTPWKVEVRERGNIEAAHNISLVNTVKADISLALKTGTETPSNLTKLMLQWKDTSAKGMDFLTERWFAGVAGTLFGAGSDTSAATLSSMILALVAYPHILPILQAELDAYLPISSPDTRSPTLSDREKGKLPYLTALITETLRWRSATPFGIPHATSEADSYNGFYIPAKTTVIANSWAINNNPLYFPSPSSFAPERYLSKSDPRYNPSLEGEDFPGKYQHSAFGWGRRQCAGADLAVTSMWILIGKLCWAYEILPVEGEVYDVDAFVVGFVSRPKPFGVQIKIRSEEHRRVLEREMKDAGEYLEIFLPFV